MILVVEDYLSELIEKNIRFLKENPDHIDKILQLSSKRRTSLKEYLVKTPIKVTKGYPRTPAELPCVCIMLSSEDEVQDGLGDYSDDEVIQYNECTEELSVVSVSNGRLPYPYVTTTNKPISHIRSVINNKDGYEYDDEEYFAQSPDLGLVGILSGNPLHNDTLTVNYMYKEVSTEDLRVMYEANFRVEIWAQNADLVVELYHVVKWIFLEGRDYLSYNVGLFRQKLGGADFEPAPSYFPEFVYRRAVQFWCEFGASIPMREIPYIQDVKSNVHISTKFDREVGNDGH